MKRFGFAAIDRCRSAQLVAWERALAVRSVTFAFFVAGAGVVVPAWQLEPLAAAGVTLGLWCLATWLIRLLIASPLPWFGGPPMGSQQDVLNRVLDVALGATVLSAGFYGVSWAATQPLWLMLALGLVPGLLWFVLQTLAGRFARPDRLFPELDDGPLRRAIERFASEADVSISAIRVQPARTRAFGRGAYIAYASRREVALVIGAEALRRPLDEALAVCAHEVAHFVRHDRTQRVLLTSATSAIALISAMVVLRSEASPALPSLLQAAAIAVLVFGLGNLLIAALARHSEYAADRAALQACGSAAVERALRRLVTTGGAVIDAPWWLQLRSDHPSIRQRLHAVAAAARFAAMHRAEAQPQPESPPAAPVDALTLSHP